VIDRSFITFGTVGNGPIGATNVVGSSTGSKGMGVQVCSETQTGLVEMTDNSLISKVNFYAAVNPAACLSTVQEISALNPSQYVSGMIVPTDKIHVGCQTGSAWAIELDIGFLFEVHTEKLSLRRIQELLVSLTAN